MGEGDRLEYDFESENDALVNITARLASSDSTHRVRLFLDGKQVSNSTKSPGMGEDTYEDTLLSEEVYVSNGLHTLRVKFIHD
eukprot:2209283-Ditylum_brightwellii.AAC.1